MAGRPAAGRHRAPLPRARRGRGPVPGPRGVGRPRRLRCLGARRALRARRLRRRTARRVQPERPGLGPAAAAARPAGRRALQVLHRHAARVHAPRGGLAHRPRDGAHAPVLGARRPRRARRGLRALSAARADGHRHAGERAQPLHGDDEMRAALARNELLSYRLLYFERGEDGAFKPPQAYPHEALVAVSTHDLPTLAGWWSGHDLQVRARLGLYTSPAQLAQQQAARAQDRERLLEALQRAGLLAEGAQAAAEAPLTQELVEAVHAYVAMAPSRVMVMQLEDALGVLDQPNLPGTVDEHPNWRRKLPLALPALAADARVQALSTRLAQLRPHAPLHASAQPRAEATVPRATYRLQFHAGFGFDDALQVLPYLQRLGVSHVYCSPLTRARPGSLHGYDVVAHDEINPELGGRAGFERFRAAARAQGLGLLLDLVPNHMGIGSDNAWWMDVLENGPASLYARYFDIDWQPVDRALEGKVLLPVLGEHFGRVLEDGRLQLRLDAARGAIELHYEEHRFPLDPRSLAPLLHSAAQRSGPGLSAALQSLAEGFERLPARDVEVLQARLQRAHDKEALKSKLAALLHADDAARGALQAELEAQDADGLEALHEAQAYRLAYWRVASDEINYRRFFDINELAALRVEEPAVFEATHGFALELAAAQAVDGLRIDHPDGLLDPAQYFERLQRGYAHRAGVVLPAQEAHGRPPRPLYVVAEKIAAAHEDVPQRWALHGTTGYRFANVANGVLVDGAARARMDRIWRGFSGQAQDFDELAHDGKRAIQRSSLASELTVLAGELLRVARAHRRTRDYTFNALREALAEVAACMPVYRTYIVDQPSPQDRRYIDWAVAQA
ncbi:MAG: malto-oligosyltrehalose synthase, partial [Betaproteobacteria bacterium]